MKEKIEVAKKEKKRVFYFDILNILAMLAVVAMHCNGIVHRNPNIRAWKSSLFVDCIMYWAVPVFFMLSGATLMTYREKYDTKTFFKRRLTKILIPFIFWTAIMFVWKYLTKQFVLDSYSIKNIISAFMSNKEESTYYFMFLILSIYITMPLLSLLAKDEYRKTLWFTVILIFILNTTIPNLLQWVGISYKSNVTVQVGNYVIYIFLGYLLSTQDLSKKQKYIIYIGAILGLIFRYFTTYFPSIESGKVIKTTWGYWTWHCVLLSIAVFVFIKGLNFEKITKNEKLKKLLAKISKCSFGIYLIHIIVKYYVVLLLKWDVQSCSFRTIGIIVVYLISLAIVWILKQIPIVKKIVP